MGGNIVNVLSRALIRPVGGNGFGMLLGPEGASSPPPLGGGFLCLPRRVRTSRPYRSCSPVVEGGAGGLSVWVRGLVGVCELDSGCEHLVVLLPVRLEVSSCRLVCGVC